jgi:hypothetical protein
MISNRSHFSPNGFQLSSKVVVFESTTIENHATTIFCHFSTQDQFTGFNTLFLYAKVWVGVPSV